MCEFCKDGKVLIEIDDIISHTSWGWGQDNIKINYKEAIEGVYGLITFVDRGFLRTAIKGDCQCLDSGDKIKINFCPMCGHYIGEEA